jgi:succinate dehydrogenase/fumarate reductase flavoprotein subunit
MVTVAGAGMAGLVAAARLRELGVAARLIEKGDRPGGSMLLSSGVLWRHRTLDGFREDCPEGNPVLQRAIVERLDDGLAWIESLGAEPTRRETGNPLTTGMRFAPRALTDVLVRRAGELRLREALDRDEEGAVVLATGGFGVALAQRLELPLRAAPWSEGDGILAGRRRGGTLTPGMDEFYGRLLPAPPAVVPPEAFVSAAQLYGRFADAYDETGGQVDTSGLSWHETDLVQEIASRPNGRAWLLLDGEALTRPAGDRTVGERVEAARSAGGTIVDPATLPFATPAGKTVAVHVVASVTHTIGGLRVDDRARVLREDGSPVEGVFAAGVDAGGVATGGYASGLAQALVLGLAAAEAAAEAV